MLPLIPGAGGYDALFYGYDGLHSNVIASAGLFYSFLDELFTRPASMVNETVPAVLHRADTFQFKCAVIVAHSLGAVIARWTLLNATQENKPWASNTKLILFAPAHTGANVSRLATLAAGSSPLLSCLLAFKFLRTPLIEELASGSPILETLRQRNAAARANGRCPHLTASRVIIAEHETIVSNLPFDGDPVPIVFRGHSHTSLCKPHSGFLQPTTEVGLFL